MKQPAIFIICYACFLLVGGLIGYLTANSFASLLMAGIVSLLLFICCYFLFQGYRAAFHTASAIIFILLLFFGYRFFMTLKLMPAGMMMLITGALLIYLSR